MEYEDMRRATDTNARKHLKRTVEAREYRLRDCFYTLSKSTSCCAISTARGWPRSFFAFSISSASTVVKTRTTISFSGISLTVPRCCPSDGDAVLVSDVLCVAFTFKAFPSGTMPDLI